MTKSSLGDNLWGPNASPVHPLCWKQSSKQKSIVKGEEKKNIYIYLEVRCPHLPSVPMAVPPGMHNHSHCKQWTQQGAGCPASRKWWAKSVSRFADLIIKLVTFAVPSCRLQFLLLRCDGWMPQKCPGAFPDATRPLSWSPSAVPTLRNGRGK